MVSMLQIPLKLSLAAALASIAACAHAPTLTDHVRSTEIALKGIDVRHESDAQAWASGVDARIAECSDRDTKSARAACMGVYGEGAEYEAHVDELEDAYDTMSEQLARARAAAAVLEALYKRAEAGK